MAAFTVETAAEMARRSHAPGSKRFIKPEPIQPMPQIITQPALNPATDSKLARVESQMAALDKALEDPADAKEWDMLTRAKERLFKAWVHLAGIPGPGQRRPGRERRQDQAQAQPLVAPTPQPVVCPAVVVSPETTPDAKPSESMPEQKPVS